MSYDHKNAVEHAEFAPQDKKDGVELSSERPVLDEETNKRLLRKIDLRLMPVVGLLWSRKRLQRLTVADVLHLRASVLRQGAPQPGGHLRTEGGPRTRRWIAILVGIVDILLWLHGRLLSSEEPSPDFRRQR